MIPIPKSKCLMKFCRTWLFKSQADFFYFTAKKSIWENSKEVSLEAGIDNCTRILSPTVDNGAVFKPLQY